MLKQTYYKEIIPKLKEKFNYKNDLAVPKLEKATVNIGFGKHIKEKAYIENIEKNLIKITGQKPVFTKAKKSISSFKIRKGMTIGAMVTLRGDRMYDFIEKLIHITLPRVRDFRGLNKKSIDTIGNLSIGFKEHLAFPEIATDDIENIHGLEVCISTTAKTKEESEELLRLLGFPFSSRNA